MPAAHAVMMTPPPLRNHYPADQLNRYEEDLNQWRMNSERIERQRNAVLIPPPNRGEMPTYKFYDEMHIWRRYCVLMDRLRDEGEDLVNVPTGSGVWDFLVYQQAEGDWEEYKRKCAKWGLRFDSKRWENE
jgi:hypothetical protein